MKAETTHWDINRTLVNYVEKFEGELEDNKRTRREKVKEFLERNVDGMIINIRENLISESIKMPILKTRQKKYFIKARNPKYSTFKFMFTGSTEPKYISVEGERELTNEEWNKYLEEYTEEAADVKCEKIIFAGNLRKIKNYVSNLDSFVDFVLNDLQWHTYDSYYNYDYNKSNISFDRYLRTLHTLQHCVTHNTNVDSLLQEQLTIIKEFNYKNDGVGKLKTDMVMLEEEDLDMFKNIEELSQKTDEYNTLTKDVRFKIR